MNREELAKKYLESVSKILEACDVKAIALAVSALFKARDNNKVIYTLGNGGSASAASHFASDLMKGSSYGKEKRFRAVCLADAIPTMMAYANDVSYADIFVEQLVNFLNDGDVVVAISGSGNSENVIRAVNYANAKTAVTIGICGFNGGKLKGAAKIPIWVNHGDMRQVEDIHATILHTMSFLLAEDSSCK